MINKSSVQRKKAIENRLEAQGITGCKIAYLPYLDFDPADFATPFEVGCRIMILSAVTFAAQNMNDSPAVIDWL